MTDVDPPLRPMIEYRYRCPRCSRAILLRQDGKLRKHRDIYAEDQPRCPGSHTTPGRRAGTRLDEDIILRQMRQALEAAARPRYPASGRQTKQLPTGPLDCWPPTPIPGSGTHPPQSSPPANSY